ncbi:choice-of-anchor M domain-containing protein [Rhizomonospora bruguierae]|uniref:choice-of-anchor M domain-containing protein n=1 Tax=Rhizomonospora bruguierae TaxID=1581705 RepID=UPI001BCDA268|nr:choice-of-anchor M domain-containing protein [Micromonospora sp. NBRC 107566]
MKARRRSRLAAAGTLSVLVGSLVMAVSGPASAQESVVLSTGHVDAVDVHYADGELVLKVHDDTGQPSVSRNPRDVVFQVLPQAAAQVPDMSEYAFLGPAGSTVWLLPMTQDPDLLWPGWNTTTLPSGVFKGEKVRLSLVDVSGPGAVSVFMTDPVGQPLMRFRSDDGLPDTLDVPVGTHAHANWVFGALGSYTLTFRADATLADGRQLSTGPVPYRFEVGDLPDPDPPVQLSIQGLQPAYAPGATVTLIAVQTPAGELNRYRWFSKCPGTGEFTAIPGETSATYSFTATSRLNDCQYVVRLYGDGEVAVAQSTPVTLHVDDAGSPAPSQRITVTVDGTQGALVVSVDPDNRTVMLPAAVLSSAGDRWESSGDLRPVTVTDTRPGAPGWNVAGQLSDFVSGAARVGGKYLGWAPTVLTQADGQGVLAGPAVAPGFAAGNGLAASSLLGSAPVGVGRGTARLGAGLTLELPTDTGAGQYTAMLTLTAI